MILSSKIQRRTPLLLLCDHGFHLSLLLVHLCSHNLTTPCVRSLMTLMTFQRLLTCALSSRRSSWRCQPPSTIKWTNCSSELFPRRVWTSSDARDCRRAGRDRQTTSQRRQRSALPAVTPSGTLEVSSPNFSRRRSTNRSPVRTSRRSDRPTVYWRSSG